MIDYGSRVGSPHHMGCCFYIIFCLVQKTHCINVMMFPRPGRMTVFQDQVTEIREIQGSQVIPQAPFDTIRQ